MVFIYKELKPGWVAILYFHRSFIIVFFLFRKSSAAVLSNKSPSPYYYVIPLCSHKPQEFMTPGDRKILQIILHFNALHPSNVCGIMLIM